MAGGYGGQLVALDAETLPELQSNAAAALQAQENARYTQQANPIKLAADKTALQQSQLALSNGQSASRVSDLANSEALMGNFLRTFDRTQPDAAAKWDQGIDSLISQGVTSAAQYRGRFNSSNLDNWAALYGGPQGGGAGAGGQAGLGGGDASQLAGVSDPTQTDQFDRLMAQLPPDKQAAATQRVMSIADAVSKVEHSPNPSAEWDQQVQALGFPQLVGHYQDKFPQVQAQFAPLARHLESRQMQSQLGLPMPKAQPQVKEFGGVPYSVDTSGPAPVVQALGGSGKTQLVGTTKDGYGVYMDPTTGEEKVGNVPLSAKPGSLSGRQSVFSQKLQAAKDSGMDQGAALAYANGTRQMGPQQAMIAAAAAAARDASNAALTGTTVDEDALRKSYYQQFTAPPVPADRRPDGAAGAAASGPATFTPQQQQALATYHGSTAPAGSIGSPYVPVTKAQYDKLPPGAHYIDTDGSVKTKVKKK